MNADRSYRIVLGLGAALYAVTAITNLGIVAIDDYSSVVRLFLPAQAHSVFGIVEASGFRPPLPVLVHFWLARLALALGVVHPVAQLRFNLLVLGLFAFALMAWAGHQLFAGEDEPDRRQHRTMFALLLGFYFLSPVVFTRPMIESLAAPWVLVAAATAALYFKGGRSWWLVAAVASVTIAATMRPQAGVIVLALPVLIALRRKWSDLVVFGAACALGFVATGLLDQALTGGFHQSLRSYIRFNASTASTFGVGPWYRFVVLFLGLSLPPVFLSRYRGLDWRRGYWPLLPVVLMFGVFLVAHSVVPHKEERFAIPALPLFFVLLTPLAVYLQSAAGQRWRVGLFALVNGLGLVLVVSSPPQQNVLQLAAWLDERPAIGRVVMAQWDILIPRAFVRHPVSWKRTPEIFTAAENGPVDCSLVLVTLENSAAAIRLGGSSKFRPVARFTPGLLESAVVWLNPRHNARRGPIVVFEPRGCVDRR